MKNKNISKKNHTLYLWLTFLLFPFGVADFYLGKITKGFLKLVFVFIFIPIIFSISKFLVMLSGNLSWLVVFFVFCILSLFVWYIHDILYVEHDGKNKQLEQNKLLKKILGTISIFIFIICIFYSLASIFRSIKFDREMKYYDNHIDSSGWGDWK